MNETDKNQWGATMERREHERTYESFLVLLKWSVVGIAVVLVVVAIAMSG
ncbi:MAG: aa3-type cytochrome c oxidase subunit IV [Hyphomicrobiales bacterium]|nr:aa3-type cytochrome c oxidase subunit IV [Hyphomicrobiales bacterium]MCY4049542.1 aa3-type cytochrome c oxidase subunit IV [Hyphomicrobiales bacterium]MCY4054112.1 aa3-type cytochrome c oxidase subunit IV [Hyphomicrobiales bacterium]